MRRISLTAALLTLLVVSVLAGATFAVISARKHRVRTPQTWRSPESKDWDALSDEYAVYSTVINQLHSEDRFKSFVIRNHTTPCLRGNDWCSDKQLAGKLPQLPQQVLDDYLIQNQKSVTLGQSSFSLRRPAVMLSDDELRELLVKIKRPIELMPLPGRRIQWGEFYVRHPLTPGVISLSRVGFNPQMDQALVYEENEANGDGTWGRYLCLMKQSDHWVIKDKVESYFPEERPPSITHGEWGTIKGLVLDAKADGLDEVRLGLISCGWDIGNLNQALARDTVLVAQLVDQKTVDNNFDLVTWYRLKTIETLSEKPFPSEQIYSQLPDPPSDIRPVNDGEFVAQETNGEMDIDGVRVTQQSNGVEYKSGKTYLIFLHIDPTKRVAVRSGTDPLGVFIVDKDGNLKPYVDRPYPLREQMTRRFGNSLDRLRNALKH